MKLIQFLDSIKDTLRKEVREEIEGRSKKALRSWMDDIMYAQDCGSNKLEVSPFYTMSGRPEIYDVSKVEVI